MNQFNPHPYQSVIIDWIRSKPRCAVFASMGSGKTVSTLTALDTFPVLIVAPLHVAENTWSGEIKKWDHLAHLKSSVITGSVKKRTEALNTPADIYTTNYENLPWLVEQLGSKWPFKTVVADESTKLKGFRSRQGSKRAKALAMVAHTMVKNIILLTGTPAPNGLLDLWGQVYFIDKGERLGKSYNMYRDRWFDSDYMGYNFTPKHNAQDSIQTLLKDVCITIKAEDWISTDEPIKNIIALNMPVKAAKAYKQMEKDMFTQLEKEGIEAANAAVKTVKCAQIANGALYKEETVNDEYKGETVSREYVVFHDEKISALSSIIEESGGMPVLVSYRFTSDLERLRKAFPYGRTLKDTSLDDWNAGKVPLLFVHPKSAGHGLNMAQGSNILVFFSLDWNLEEHLQVIERIGALRQKQLDINRPVYLYYILMKDTIDELILERLSSKKSVQEVLLKAMKHFKGE